MDEESTESQWAAVAFMTTPEFLYFHSILIGLQVVWTLNVHVCICILIYAHLCGGSNYYEKYDQVMNVLFFIGTVYYLVDHWRKAAGVIKSEVNVINEASPWIRDSHASWIMHHAICNNGSCTMDHTFPCFHQKRAETLSPHHVMSHIRNVFHFHQSLHPGLFIIIIQVRSNFLIVLKLFFIMGRFQNSDEIIDLH